jgi:hypothetical protein
VTGAPKRGFWKSFVTPTGHRVPGYVEPPPVQYGPRRYVRAVACWGFVIFWWIGAYLGHDATDSAHDFWTIIEGCLMVALIFVPWGAAFWRGKIKR